MEKLKFNLEEQDSSEDKDGERIDSEARIDSIGSGIEELNGLHIFEANSIEKAKQESPFKKRRESNFDNKQQNSAEIEQNKTVSSESKKKEGKSEHDKSNLSIENRPEVVTEEGQPELTLSHQDSKLEQIIKEQEGKLPNFGDESEIKRQPGQPTEQSPFQSKDIEIIEEPSVMQLARAEPPKLETCSEEENLLEANHTAEILQTPKSVESDCNLALMKTRYSQVILLALTISLCLVIYSFRLVTATLSILRFKEDLDYNEVTILYCQNIIHLGASFGALLYIALADFIGRKNCLLGGISVSLLFAVSSITNTGIFLAMTFIFGMTITIAFLSVISLILEQLSIKGAFCLISTAFIGGLATKGLVVWLAGKLDYLDLESKALLILQLILLSLVLICLILALFIEESPKYLAFTGNTAEFERIMKLNNNTESHLKRIWDRTPQIKHNLSLNISKKLILGVFAGTIAVSHYGLLSDIDPYIFSYYHKLTELGEFEFERNYESLCEDTLTAILTETPPLLCLLILTCLWEIACWKVSLISSLLTAICSIQFLLSWKEDKLQFMLISKAFIPVFVISLVVMIGSNKITSSSANLGLLWSNICLSRCISQLLLPILGTFSQNTVITFALLVGTINSFLSAVFFSGWFDKKLLHPH